MPARLVSTLFVYLLCASMPDGMTAAPAWPTDAWPQSDPAAQGLDPLPLADMLQRIADSDPGINSVTVVRHGYIVLDVRFPPFAAGYRHDIHSCTKSVLSALVGIALERGELPGLDARVPDFFPGSVAADPDDRKRDMTLRHLLTMSAGLRTEDSYQYGWSGLNRMRASPDWAKYVLDLPLAAAPGTRFEYSNGVSELIALILQSATGMSAGDYARTHLFGPIGIEDFVWQGSNPDDSWGFSGLSLHPLDMARLGYLYLHGGEWNGKQVVPAEWVRESTAPQIAAGTLARDYGYQWWVDDGMFMMQGYGGQFVYVLPQQDMVVVFTSVLPDERFFIPRSLLSRYIEPAAVSDRPLLPRPAATARLDSLVGSIGHVTATPPAPLPALARAVSDRTYTIDSNRLGLRNLTLRVSPGVSEAELDFVLGTAEASLRVGLDGVFRVSDLFGQAWACRGGWTDDGTFIVDQEAPGTVLRRRLRLQFRDDDLELEVEDRLTGEVEQFSGRRSILPPVPAQAR